MSNANDDLPEPLTPVTTMSSPSGRSRSRARRLFCRAPRMRMTSLFMGDLTAGMAPPETNCAERRGNVRAAASMTRVERHARVGHPRRARSPENDQEQARSNDGHPPRRAGGGCRARDTRHAVTSVGAATRGRQPPPGAARHAARNARHARRSRRLAAIAARPRAPSSSTACRISSTAATGRCVHSSPRA